MKPIVLTEGALQVLASTTLAAEWFVRPATIPGTPIKVYDGSEGIYVTTESCTIISRLLVIACSNNGLFGGVPENERRSVFDRCLRIALHAFDSSVTLNPNWMAYHSGNRISVFAYGLGHKERILAERNVNGEGHVYIYALGEGAQFLDLAKSKPEYEVYDRAIAGFMQIGPQEERVTTEGDYSLLQLEQATVNRGHTYSDWYPQRLTLDQLKFVDHELVGPLRLRGAAGTGKTLAMAIKALKTKYEANAKGKEVAILFITHSWAMAEFVDRLIISIDENPDSRATIDVLPLLSLAEGRDYKQIGRQLLGIDSDEGKRLALKEIAQVVQDFLVSDWIAYKSECTKEFSEQLECHPASQEHRLFCWDLLVEFGCVIGAQGIFTSSGDRERYLRIRRQRWMMQLDNTAERSVVFALWQKFMLLLREKGLIQTDQVVSDYLNELGTFYWDAARSKNGYDYIFVDETHLFNAQERLIFHNLLRDDNARPLVVMAIDPRQSPRETYTSVDFEGDGSTPHNIFERARLPNPEKIDLIDVFRYSPEIGRVISAIRAAAPGLDPIEDWDIDVGQSVAPSGPIPVFHIVDNATSVFRTAMGTAINLQKEAREHSGRIAILCMDDDRFEKYKVAAGGQFKKETFIVASRDDIESLRYSGRRTIISTPEYVAGLQFDTVILVDVNKDQVPDGKYHGFHLRRFLSQLYLGASRAQRSLIIIASKDQGGLSPTLQLAVDHGNLQIVQV